MKLKARTGALLAAASVVAAGLLSMAAPASATLPTKGEVLSYSSGLWYNYWAQADNKPGDGSASWVVVWSPSNDNRYGDHVDVRFEGGFSATYWAPYGGSNVQHPSLNITSFRVCGPNGWGGDICSPWKYLQPA
jgi:hypothetical protein